jgi:hypothetical protein
VVAVLLPQTHPPLQLHEVVVALTLNEKEIKITKVLIIYDNFFIIHLLYSGI